MSRTTRPYIDRSREFIDYSGSVFKHLIDYGVRIANWGKLAHASVRVQEDLRVPPSTPWLGETLATLWQELDAHVCAPAVEEAFGVDLTGVPEQTIRLIAFYALTTLMPGQRPEIPFSSVSEICTAHILALGLRQLQDGRRAEAMELLEAAAERVPVE